MNMNHPNVTNANIESVLATNKVIRNTYILLSTTLIFSAITAVASMSMNMGLMTNLASSGIALLLMWFVLPRTANSATGVGVVFAITGLLGFGLGPILNHYLAMQNGGQLIATAAGGTGIIFMALSTYALTTRKDFSFMGGFLMVGLVVAIIASLANIFMGIPALSLAISAAVIMIMSGLILYDTSRMINDPNANYIMMTIGLFLSILNIFTSLLHILGAFSGDD